MGNMKNCKYNPFVNISGLQRGKITLQQNNRSVSPSVQCLILATPMAAQPENKLSAVIQCNIQHHLLCILTPQIVLISGL